jgi:hypothetical protein
VWRNYSRLLAIVSLSVSPALADVVGVTFTGNADFSGSVIARCFSSPSCYDQEFLSSSYTNNNQNNFTASGSVTADDRVTLSTSVQQITDVSPTSFSVDLQSLATVDAFGAEWGAGTNGGPAPLILNAVYLDFTLTTESGMDLTELGGFSAGDSYCSLNNTDLSVNISLPCRTSDQFFLLGPGSYVLSLHDELNASFGPNGYPFPEQMETDGMMMNADFTPIVPEPRWGTFLPAAVPVVFLGYASLRRRRRA